MCLGENNMNKKTMKQTKLNLTKDELQWIEEQADIQSSMLMDKFVNLMKIPKENVKEKEPFEHRPPPNHNAGKLEKFPRLPGFARRRP